MDTIHGQPDTVRVWVVDPSHGQPDTIRMWVVDPSHEQPDTVRMWVVDPSHGQPDTVRVWVVDHSHGQPDTVWMWVVDVTKTLSFSHSWERTMSSHSSHHPHEILLAKFSLYEHKVLAVSSSPRPWIDVFALLAKIQHGGDWERSWHQFLSWACGLVTEMLVILKSYFRPDD